MAQVVLHMRQVVGKDAGARYTWMDGGEEGELWEETRKELARSGVEMLKMS